MHWLDVEEIAEMLLEEYPDIDPVRVTFPQLRDLIENLEDFEEREGHPCNERILETIQGLWIEERQETRGAATGNGGGRGTGTDLDDGDDDDDDDDDD